MTSKVFRFVHFSHTIEKSEGKQHQNLDFDT